MKFILCPSEAVLLGLAAGEYTRLCELARRKELTRFLRNSTFQDVLYHRVYPFVGDLSLENPRLIEESDFLGALCWCGENGGFERGGRAFRPTNPLLFLDDDQEAPEEEKLKYENEERAFDEAEEKLNAWLDHQPAGGMNVIGFARKDGRYYVVESDDSRNSLLDLLVQHLTDGSDHPRTKFNDPNTLRARWRIADAESPANLLDLPPDEVDRKIRLLIDDDENRHAEFYRFGKLLGRTFADCVAIEPLLIHMDDLYVFEESHLEIEDFREVKREELPGPELMQELTDESWSKLIAELANDRFFARCYFDARGFLNRLRLPIGKGSSAGGYFGMILGDLGELTINAAIYMRTGLSLVLGYALGVLREVDREAEVRDAQRPTPRQFAINPGAAAEMVGGRLLMAEQAFNSRDGAVYLPLELIASIGGGIEALSKDLWVFDGKQKLSDVLHKNRKFGTPLERRFADVALTLYTHYRNPVEHEPNTFKCSPNSARHFMTGIRELHDLHKQIKTERRLNRG